jgi:hypothetical protein
VSTGRRLVGVSCEVTTLDGADYPGYLVVAMIVCPECGSEVSDQAPHCPHCGVPIATPQLSEKSTVHVGMPGADLLPPERAIRERKPLGCFAWSMIIGGAGLLILWMGGAFSGCLSIGDRLPLSTDLPTTTQTVTTQTATTRAPSPPRVEYIVSGTPGFVSLTMRNSTGGTEQFDDVVLPYSRKLTGFESGDFVYISAQRQGKDGTLKCPIKVNTVIRFRSSSEGEYSICTASGSVP